MGKEDEQGGNPASQSVEKLLLAMHPCRISLGRSQFTFDCPLPALSPQGCLLWLLGWVDTPLAPLPCDPASQFRSDTPLQFRLTGFRIPLKLILSITTAVIAVYQVTLTVKCQAEPPPCLLGCILSRRRSPEVIATPRFWLWGWS